MGDSEVHKETDEWVNDLFQTCVKVGPQEATIVSDALAVVWVAYITHFMSKWMSAMQAVFGGSDVWDGSHVFYPAKDEHFPYELVHIIVDYDSARLGSVTDVQKVSSLQDFSNQ